MTTNLIQVTACDNELYIIAVPHATGSFASYEVCHISSGYNAPVNYSINPKNILPPGKYNLIMVGVDWGVTATFSVTVTTDGKPKVYTWPSAGTGSPTAYVAPPMVIQV